MANFQYFIGLMSGTSLDGVDAALVQIDSDGKVELVDFYCFELDALLAQELARISVAESVNLEQLGQLNIKLAKLFAQACNHLLVANALCANQITAIGCHGVTVRHCPDIEHAFTLQLTDPNTLSALTGIDVIADLRGMDVAYQGQGAPLVPKFHRALLSQQQQGVFVNLGGIANITVIARDKPILGYDTGPANTLMNIWCQQNIGKDYDDGGQWARTGKVCKALLNHFLADEYFTKSWPKSTGKEKFNLSWLQANLAKISDQLKPEDVQATLLVLTVTTVAEQIRQFKIKDVFLCGGGANNPYLVEQLVSLLPSYQVNNTTALGVGVDEMEAMAFAWFAYCRINGINANVPSVTGAQQECVLGAWYSSNSGNSN